MHRLKCLFPTLKRIDTSKDWSDIKLTGAHHSKDSLPHRPVVAKASLQGHVLLHELVEREIQWLWTPANFGNPPRRAHQL